MIEQGLTFNISAVERETGLSKDVLRMWERRYAFPKPGRDDNGERQYSPGEVAKLRAIKRLMDVGLRPGKLIARSLDELNALADARIEGGREASAPPLEREVIGLLRSHDVSGLQRALAHLLMRQGIGRFVAETVAPLNQAVGDAWMRGDLQIFEEHLYTEHVQAALRTAIRAISHPGGSPRVLLTTLPGEQHALGLLMLEALLSNDGVACMSLGVQTPLDELRRAALAHRAHVVALSFSAAFAVRQGTDSLATLRRELPSSIALWAGGEMTRRVRKTLPGVLLLPDLASALEALATWRAHALPAASP